MTTVSLRYVASRAFEPPAVSVQSRLVEFEFEGGPPLIVLAGVISFFIATVLAVIVTYRFVEGYRRTSSRPVLLLAIGMFFLAPAPMFIRLLTANAAALPLIAQRLATSLSELAGLLVVLYVVYRS